MTVRVKTLLVMLVALLLAVPTGALAKGKPSWAGQGNGGGHGKPSWAGQGNGKADKAKGHEKAKAAHEKKAKKEKKNKFGAEAADEDATDPDELSLEDLEALEAIHAPGQYCHALESFQDSLAGLWGGDSFDEHFGENANLANSHGKCASWRAQGGELDEEAAEEEPAEESCEPTEEEGTEEGAEEGTEEGSEEGSEEPAEEECETEETEEESELSPEDLEELEAISAPGQYCHMLESMEELFAGMWDGASFDENFGENANLANSHGKCASWRAQGGTSNEEEGAEEAAEDEEAADEPAEDEPAEDGDGDESEDADGEPEDEDEPVTITFTLELDLDLLLD